MIQAPHQYEYEIIPVCFEGGTGYAPLRALCDWLHVIDSLEAIHQARQTYLGRHMRQFERDLFEVYPAAVHEGPLPPNAETWYLDLRYVPLWHVDLPLSSIEPRYHAAASSMRRYLFDWSLYLIYHTRRSRERAGLGADGVWLSAQLAVWPLNDATWSPPPYHDLEVMFARTLERMAVTKG